MNRRPPQSLLRKLGQPWAVIAGFFLVLGWIPQAWPASPPPAPDRLVVKKAARKLYLLRDGRVLKSYPIHLGGNPVGHKLHEGDSRTPEGRYLLDWRNPESRFYRSIHISYPRDHDVRQAEARGSTAGGNIMIHGFPNELGEHIIKLRGRDWTDGCIAVSNADMKEIWELVQDNTPIDIRP